MYERKEDENGYIIYINTITGQTQIEDPNLIELLKRINEECSHNIRYTTYRCANKILALKNALYTEHISFQTVKIVLKNHQLNQTDNAPVIRPSHLTSLIHEIFLTANKMHCFADCLGFDIEVASAMLSNFIWKTFDGNRTSSISLLEFRQTLLLLCQTDTMEQTIYEHLMMTCDHNRCVTRYRFESMVRNIATLFSCIDDNINYSQDLILDLVYECFQQCPGIVGLNEYQFNCLWQNSSIHFAHYANVFGLVKRMRDAQDIYHNSECVACHTLPIQGLRFKCHHCRKLSLCFNCFATGYSNKRHELSHRMYEISSAQIPNKCTSYISKLCSMFTRNTVDGSNMTTETNLVEINENDVIPSGESEIMNTKLGNSKLHKIQGIDNTILMYQSGMDKLLAIIELLSEENKILHNQIYDKNDLTTHGKQPLLDFMKSHQIILIDVITELRNIWENSISTILPHTSTPFRQTTSSGKRDYCNSLSQSVKGADINRTFLENNRSDISISDVSTWFHTKKLQYSLRNKNEKLPTVSERVSSIDTDMINFKDLLHVVKDIIDDSYSDNTELSAATNRLERVLNEIISEEERKRNK